MISETQAPIARFYGLIAAGTNGLSLRVCQFSSTLDVAFTIYVAMI